MTTVKRFSFVLAFSLFALASGARAQTPQVSTVNVTPDSDKVRVAAVGDVLDMRSPSATRPATSSSRAGPSPATNSIGP
jgi:hypothetical protein